jgi:hypothetical protein
MFCRLIILCLLNYSTENIQVTEGRMRLAGRMLVSPDLYVGGFFLSKRTRGRSLRTFQTAMLFRKSGSIVQKSTFTSLVH